MGTLIFLLLIAGGAYLAFSYVPPWIAYRAIQDQMLDQARNATLLTDQQIAVQITVVAKEWEVPLTERDVTVTRTENRLAIRAEWDVTINHFGLFPHRVHFAPAVDEMILPIAR